MFPLSHWWSLALLWWERIVRRRDRYMSEEWLVAQWEAEQIEEWP